MLNGATLYKIKRSLWLRGSFSCLLDNNDKKCCLGFICEQNNILKSFLFDKETPEDLNIIVPGLTEFYHNIIVNSELSKKAIQINDNSLLSDYEIENKLIYLFKQNGIKLVFED